MRSIATSLVLALALTFGACAHASPTLTPEAAVAFNADRVVHVLSVVQDSAISLNANGFLNDADTSLVIKAVTAAVKTIQTVPSGAYATVNAALTNLQTSLSPQAAAKMGPYIVLAQGVVNEVQAFQAATHAD